MSSPESERARERERESAREGDHLRLSTTLIRSDDEEADPAAASISTTKGGTTAMEKKIDKLLLGVEEILKAVTQNQISSRKPTIQQSNSFDDDDLDFHDKGYDIEDAIGMGNNPVYRVKDSKTEELFALKCISLDDNEVPPEVARELSLMFDIQHEHIVRLNRAFFHRNSLCLIMELAYEDLNESIAMKSQDSKDVKKWMKQIISAIAYLHNRSIVHRDLKPANILVSANRNMKLADFGLARVLFEGAQLTPRVMTLEYRAPELLPGCETYSPAVDMWSLGCIFWYMIDHVNADF